MIVSLWMFEWFHSDNSPISNRVIDLILAWYIIDMAMVFIYGLALRTPEYIYFSFYLIVWLFTVGKLKQKTNELIHMSPFWLYYSLSVFVLSFVNLTSIFFIFNNPEEIQASQLSRQTLYLKVLLHQLPSFLLLTALMIGMHRLFLLQDSDMFVLPCITGLFLDFMWGNFSMDIFWLLGGAFLGIYGSIFSFIEPFNFERGKNRYIYPIGIVSILLVLIVGNFLGLYLIQMFLPEN